MVAELGVPRRVPGPVGLHLFRLLDAQYPGTCLRLLVQWNPSPACSLWSVLRAHLLQLLLAPPPWVQLAVHGSFRNLYVRDTP